MQYCEALNSMNQVEFKEKPNPVVTPWPHSWPDGDISYRLNNFSDDIPLRKHQVRAITVAFRVWQLRIERLNFRREYNKDTNVDMDISFKSLDHFSSKGVLAHAWFPGQGQVSGDIEFNDEWDWVTHSRIGNIGHPPIVPVAIHEIGHGLGLRHNLIDRESIMYPSFNLGEKKNDLNYKDVELIQDRYGKRKLSKRIIDYFKRRRDLGLDFR